MRKVALNSPPQCGCCAVAFSDLFVKIARLSQVHLVGRTLTARRSQSIVESTVVPSKLPSPPRTVVSTILSQHQFHYCLGQFFSKIQHNSNSCAMPRICQDSPSPAEGGGQLCLSASSEEFLASTRLILWQCVIFNKCSPSKGLLETVLYTTTKFADGLRCSSHCCYFELRKCLVIYGHLMSEQII